MLCTITLTTYLLFCSAGEGTTYTVSKGDTLFKIAEHFYGEGRLWPSLSKANPGLDPQKLIPGNTIQIPAMDNKTNRDKPINISRATYSKDKAAKPVHVSYKTYSLTISRDTDLMLNMLCYVLIGCIAVTVIQSILFYTSGQVFNINKISILSSFKATFLTEFTYFFLTGAVFILTFTLINTLLGKTELSFHANIEHFWYTLKTLPFQLPLLLSVIFLYACVGFHFLRSLCKINILQALLIVFTGSVLPALGIAAFIYTAYV